MHPSRLAAVAWFTWLVLAGLVTGFAIELPAFTRVGLCVLLATTGILTVREFVLLAGSRAVRAIEWNNNGEFFVFLGAALERHPATIASGTFRLGKRFWVLRFTTPPGPRSVLVEEAFDDVRSFRRLSRRLTAHLRRGSGRRDHPADTIPPKV